MIIFQDSQIKKIFHNGDEVKKILDLDGNVIFYKQSGGGDVPMTNDIKFHTTSAATSSNVFTVTYTDSTQDTVSYSEPNKEYSLSIPTDKIVNKIDFDNTMVDEVKVSCKVNLSNTFFTNKPKTIRILNCDATSSTSLANLLSDSSNIETIEMKDLDVRNVTDMGYMFYNCRKATTIEIANWNTSSVTNLSNAFSNCRMVQTLDLSSWNTSNVTNIGWMFSKCSGLTSLNLSGWDMTNATHTSNMFRYCNKLNTIKMIGCNQTTIDKIKSELTNAKILNQVTIITE